MLYVTVVSEGDTVICYPPLGEYVLKTFSQDHHHIAESTNKNTVYYDGPDITSRKEFFKLRYRYLRPTIPVNAPFEGFHLNYLPKLFPQWNDCLWVLGTSDLSNEYYKLRCDQCSLKNVSFEITEYSEITYNVVVMYQHFLLGYGKMVKYWVGKCKCGVVHLNEYK